MAGPGAIVPEPIQGGLGPNAAPRGRSYGVDYRQLQEPEQAVPSWALSRDAEGIGSEARALGQTFREFEGISGNIEKQGLLKAGALAGAASGATGHPQYKQGFERFTAYGQAFDNAATGAYAVQAEAQADDAAARLRVQANNDPAAFYSNYTAVRDGVVKEAPPEAQPILTEIYNKRLAEGMSALSAAQAADQQRVHRSVYLEGIQRQTARVAALDASTNPEDQARSADELTKLTLLINGGVTAGLYAPADAEAYRVGAMRAITEQTFETQFDQQLSDPNGDPVGYLQRFMRAHEANLRNPNQPAVLSDKEYQSLLRVALQKMYEHNAAIAMQKRQGTTAEQARWQRGEQQYTVRLLQGQLTDSQIAIGVQNGDLKPSIGRALAGMLRSGDQVKSDPKALYDAYSDPDNLDWSATHVAGLPGINWTDKMRLMEHLQKERDDWNGTQQVKLARAKINAVLKIPPGTPMAMLSPAQRQAAVEAQQEFTQQMQAMDPAKRIPSAMTVAQNVITRVRQQQAAQQASVLQQGEQQFINMYGPSSTDPMSRDRYEARLGWYKQQIAQQLQAAKAQ